NPQREAFAPNHRSTLKGGKQGAIPRRSAARYGLLCDGLLRCHWSRDTTAGWSFKPLRKCNLCPIPLRHAGFVVDSVCRTIPIHCSSSFFCSCACGSVSLRTFRVP